MINYDYRELTGEVITREDFEYEEERKGWNRAIEKYPLVIVYCECEEDIRNAIIFAMKTMGNFCLPFMIWIAINGPSPKVPMILKLRKKT